MAGSTEVDAIIAVNETELVHRFRAPKRWPRAQPLVIEFQLLDVLGKLHFLDFLDHTEQRVLGRLEPDVHQRMHWSGRFVTSLEQIGLHHLTVRIVRHDPSRETPVFFEDYGFQVEIVND